MAGEDLDKYMADEPEVNQEPAAAPSPSNDVKPEVKQPDLAVPYVDEKGVPYFNRFKEMSEKLEKFKDVDVDRWGKVKDFDPDKVAKALELEKLMTSNPEKFAKALALYEEQEEAKAEEEAQAEGAKSDPKYLTADDLDKRLEEREYKKAQADWMKEWKVNVEKSMLNAVKSESLKDFGELHDLDKEIILQKVAQKFQDDANSGNPKLSMKDVSQITDQVVKSLYEYRTAIRGQSVKKDPSPQSISGNKGDGMKKPVAEEVDEIEDTKEMISLYKELSNPQI